MEGKKYIKLLVEDIHSSTVATLDKDGHPKTRIIDLMYYDEEGIYFLTAKGKNFYKELMEQEYVAISATKDKRAVSLSGKVKNIGKKNLDILFERNPYMAEIYPKDTRVALEVFVLYEAAGEYFDISVPSHIVRESITIGSGKPKVIGYHVTSDCVGCGSCYFSCPQKCIDFENVMANIHQDQCLHCGNCMDACMFGAIEKREE